MKDKILLIVTIIIFIGIMVLAGMILNEYGNIYYEGKNLELKEDNDAIVDNSVVENTGEFSEAIKEEEENMKILELTSENFENDVLKSEKTVLIDFYAEWCGPCKMMTPVVEAVAKENENVKVCKLNVDEVQDIAIKYGVMSIPTFIVIKNGEEVDRIVGAVDKSTLENAIK